MADAPRCRLVRIDAPHVLELGKWRFELSAKALVMGIVNRTPDSFFDQGETFALERARRRAAELVEQGADLIDVGGIKAGSGPAVSSDEEIDRVLPVVEWVSERFDVPVSVDTWRAKVLEAALSRGAVLGNDISGFADPSYLPTAARHGASVVVCHIRLRPRLDDPEPRYPGDDVVGAVEHFLLDRLEMARLSGIPKRRVLFDVGLDLGKTTPQSLELMRAGDRFSALGQPMLLSASNKGFLGDLLGLPVDRRRDASLAAVALAVATGYRVVRVHDVAGARRAVDTLGAILNQ